MSDDVTRLLHRLRDGDRDALERLLPLVYDEIRAIAERHMRNERAGHTLQPTALVHEAYMKLVERREADWESRAHFLGVAAQAIRRILVDHARAKKRHKRGGDAVRVTLTDEVSGAGDRELDVLALDRALEKLGEEDAVDRQVVELRFFAGLGVGEIAKLLGVTERTIHRRWTFARTWLFRELSGGASAG